MKAWPPLSFSIAGFCLGIVGGYVTAEFISWWFDMDHDRFEPIKLTLAPARIAFGGLWSVMLSAEGWRFGRDCLTRTKDGRKFIGARALRIAVSAAGAFAGIYLGLVFGWEIALNLSDFYRPYAHAEDELVWLISFSQVLFGCQIGMVLAWIAFRVGRYALGRALGLVGLAIAFEASERSAWWVWEAYRLHATSFEDLTSKFALTQHGTLILYSVLLIGSGLLLGSRLEGRFRAVGA